MKYHGMSLSNAGKNLLYFLLLAFLNVSNPVLADDFQSFADDRNKAKQLLREGRYASGLNKLAGLAKLGDAVAANDLGVIYLKSKIRSIPRNPELSERYFRVAAELCYDPSIKILKKLFYNRKGSGFFDPLKSERLAQTCSVRVEEKKSPVVDLAQAPKPKAKDETSAVGQISSNVRVKWAENLPVYDSAKGEGSSVAINGEGVFLTNHHVIEGCENIAIIYNGMKARGKVTAYDSALDVALVDAKAPSPFHVKIDSSEPMIGESLIALGYPIGPIFGVSPSFSSGKLTNAGDEKTAIRKEGFLLTSVPMAAGNSGGPVFNQTGAIRGIVSYGYDSTVVQKEIKESISTVTLNFIVSSIKILRWLELNDVRHQKLNSPDRVLSERKITAYGQKTLAKIECY